VSLSTQVKQYQAMDKWFLTPQGVRIAAAFNNELRHLDEDLYGKTLLQLGNCGENHWLKHMHYYRKWLLTPSQYIDNTTFVSPISDIPLDKHSVDCVIAPLSIEMLSLNDHLLIEMDRILKPMGHLVFLGVNPFSFYGLGLKWGRVPFLKDAISGLTSSLTLKRRLVRMGYRQVTHRNFYYIPPVTQSNTIHRLEFFNEVGKMLWPFPAGFYCLVVQKHQYNLAHFSQRVESELLVETKPTMPIGN
jgi:hypothetical protein